MRSGAEVGGLDGWVVQELLAGAGEASPQGEAVAALVTLGYGQSEAAAAVAGLDPELPVDGLIKGALRKLSRGV